MNPALAAFPLHSCDNGEKATKCEKHEDLKGSIADHYRPVIGAFLLLHSAPMTIERLVRSEGNNKMMINVKSWAVLVH